jgi:acetyl esterase/lipase
MDQVSVTQDEQGNLHLGPRVIPIPTTITPEARKFLAVSMPVRPQPALEDSEGWKAMVASTDAFLAPMTDHMLAAANATVETRTIGECPVHVATPKAMRHPDRAHLRIHGGAWVYLGGKFSLAEAAMTASAFGCVTYGVDYRMPPDHPYPAAVDDGVTAYRALLEHYDPKKIVISGASAGGNLTAAVTLKVRDLGLPMPGAVGLLTPALDLTFAGDTIATNHGIDTVLPGVGNAGDLYAGGHDLTDPYISPLCGDLTKGFPPTFLQSGTRDLLLSDTVRMHRKLLRAGIPAELHVWEAMPHGGFGGTFGAPAPEDLELEAALVAFVDKWLG